MNIINQINEGKTSVGIEFGSTRIKAVLIGNDYQVIGSGMFPIDVKKGKYNEEMLARFNELTSKTAFDQDLIDVLPEIVPAGKTAGTLT